MAPDKQGPADIAHRSIGVRDILLIGVRGILLIGVRVIWVSPVSKLRI